MDARPSRSSAVIIAIGLVVAAIVAPVAATAAGQLVEISSTSGRKADVTRAAQLQAAEASAHQFVRGWHGTGGPCAAIIAAPTSKAVVVKTASVDFVSLNTTGPDQAALIVGTDCSFPTVDRVTAQSVGSHQLDFGSGLVVPAGQSLLLSVTSGGTVAFVSAFGYKVPPDAAP